MDIKGYVNPRSLGNTEPNEFFGFDIFIEEELWQRYVNNKHEAVRNTRTYDICSMLRFGCLGGPASIQRKEQTFKVFLKGKEMTLRAYIHPQVMALCVVLSRQE
jgi:hypothetical protein